MKINGIEFDQEILRLVKSNTRDFDANSKGPRPAQFGEHAPIPEEAVCMTVAIVEAPQAGGGYALKRVVKNGIFTIEIECNK